MRRSFVWPAALSATALLVACGSATKASPAADVDKFVYRTAPASKTVGALTWNLGYEPTSLDPVKAADYSENQVLANICESLQKPTADLTFQSGLATASNPTPMTWVYDINPAARFSDGSPVTGQDAAFSLNRHLDPKLSSYYSFYYRNVKSIRATGSKQVTVFLSKPDYVFNEGMASAAGAVIEQSYAQKAGAKLGTPSGGIRCSGPFTFDSWIPGASLNIKRSDRYWRPDAMAKAPSVKFSFLSDDTAQTNALTSGAIDGEYQVPFSAVNKLKASTTGQLYLGQSLIEYDLVVAATSGPLSDSRVRTALSMAIDRNAVAQTVFSGAATPARSLVTKATTGYGKDVFLAAYNKQGPLAFDVTGAKKLLATVPNLRPIVFAYPTGGPSYNNQVALAVQSAGASIGLKIVLKGIPNDTYQSDFYDSKVTKGVDLEELSWYIDGPEPLVMYEQFLPNVSPYNVSKYNNASVNNLINEAAATADPNKRAQLVVSAQDQITHDLPWIPLVQEANTLYLSNKYGNLPASFIQNSYPWAADVAGR